MAYPRQSIELSLDELGFLAGSLFRKRCGENYFVERFEKAVAEFIGVRHAISFGSQRAGMWAVLKSLNPKEGEEVILPAYTFFSVPACVVLSGFRPVFAEVLPESWNLDPNQVQKAVTPKTRALIVTHLNGCPADMTPLVEIARKNNLTLIEDCAQAFGAVYQSREVGGFGIGCFSFGEGKNLYAMGGGLITTQDDRLASALREMRAKSPAPGAGSLLTKIGKSVAFSFLTRPFVFTLTTFPAIYLSSFKNGPVDTDREHTIQDMIDSPSPSPLPLKGERVRVRGSKFSDPQAALGLAQLKNLEKRNTKRIDNARWLSEALKTVKEIALPPSPTDRTHLYLHYPVRVIDREKFVRSLIRKGVDAQRDYCSYCPDLPDFRGALTVPSPVAKSLAGNVAYLPNQPSLSKSDIHNIARRVIQSIV